MVTSSSFGSTTRFLVASGLLATVVTGVVAGVAVADVDDFSFESFDAEYRLDVDENKTPTLEIREHLVALFPDVDQNRGIARAIPLWFDRAPLNPRVDSVVDEFGNARAWSTYEEDDFLWVESVVPPGEYVRGRQSYELKYVVDNPIQDYSESTGYQEFYWDINGNGWPQSFGRVSATLVIQREIATALVPEGVSCYVGEFGETTQCPVEIREGEKGEVVVSAQHEGVGPYQTLTIAVPFQPGTFLITTRPYWTSAWAWWQIVAAIVGSLSLLSAIRLRRRILADAPGRPVIVAEYLPPKDVSVIEGAILLNRPSSVLQASLLELAVSDAAVLVQDPSRPRVWSLRRTSGALKPQQSQLLDVVFGGALDSGETKALPRQSALVARRLEKWLGDTRDSMMAEGFFRRVGVAQRLWPIAGGVGAMVVGFFSGVTALTLRYGPLEVVLLWTISLVAGGLAIALSTRRPLGQRGADVRDHLKGLSDYIELAESDRLAYLQSPQGALRTKVNDSDTKEVIGLYERLLPWAVLLGHEKKWLAALDRLYRDQEPRWIVGPVGPLTQSVSSLGRVAHNAALSSSSGGSGGSGSAGGGGGGGGGGGR
jgi:hypothetical protein